MYNSKFWRITLDTNPDDCNLHCIMCEEHSYLSEKREERLNKNLKPRRMTLEILGKCFKEIVELGIKEVIPSTMGEPLLYEHFMDIVSFCKENNVKLNLTTNGTFTRGGVDFWAKHLLPVLSDIKISWNGVNKETQEQIMQGSKWEKRLLDLQRFIWHRNNYYNEHGKYITISFQLTFLTLNVFEIPDIVSKAISLGIDRVKGHHVWIHNNTLNQCSLINTPDKIEQWNYCVDKSLEIVNEHNLNGGKSFKLDNFNKICNCDSRNSIEDTYCPFLGKEIWINTEGRFDPCCAPDEIRKTLGSFSDINNKSLKEIVYGENYQELVTNYNNNELCKKCNMRRPINKKDR